MKVMRRSRWLARLAAMLVVGVAGVVAVASAPAQAGINQIAPGPTCTLALRSNAVSITIGVPAKHPCP